MVLGCVQTWETYSDLVLLIYETSKKKSKWSRNSQEFLTDKQTEAEGVTEPSFDNLIYYGDDDLISEPNGPRGEADAKKHQWGTHRSSAVSGTCE